MDNPWKNIPLDTYENHMSLDSINQLQTLDLIMKDQFDSYDVTTAMVLGAAGGNGLRNIDTDKYTAVYAVDINAEYLEEAKKRYSYLGDVLRCICTDLTTGYDTLPTAELVTADLLIEYIGYECFRKVIRQTDPLYVSCAVQINTDESFVSDSPYLHSFDSLSDIHHQIDPNGLKHHMSKAGYHHISDREYPLPNGKKLIRSDFKKI